MTDFGREQAAATAQKLRQFDSHKIICSPYRRAIQTALIIREELALPLSVDTRVGERAAFICDIGSTRTTLSATWPDLTFDHIDEVWWPDIGESEESVDMRGLHFRRWMQQQRDWQGTIVVTHWGFIRALTDHRVENGAIVRFDPHAAHPGGGTVVSPSDV